MKFNEFAMIKAQAEAGDPAFGRDYSGVLTERERHLIGITVALMKGCRDCTATRLINANKAQIDETAVKEAINLVTGMNSGFIITTAVKSQM